jgi:hypothetical protein
MRLIRSGALPIILGVCLFAGYALAQVDTIKYAISQETPKGSGTFVATGQIFDTGTTDPVAAAAAAQAEVVSLQEQNGCCYAATQQ